MRVYNSLGLKPDALLAGSKAALLVRCNSVGARRDRVSGRSPFAKIHVKFHTARHGRNYDRQCEVVDLRSALFRGVGELHGPASDRLAQANAASTVGMDGRRVQQYCCRLSVGVRSKSPLHWEAD